MAKIKEKLFRSLLLKGGEMWNNIQAVQSGVFYAEVDTQYLLLAWLERLTADWPHEVPVVLDCQVDSSSLLVVSISKNSL